MCGDFGVAGFTVPGKTGVWTAGGKIAAIGVGVRRWVSMHGFCLNVAPDISPFKSINPCGMRDCRITSISLERGETVAVGELKKLAAARFETLLNTHLPFL